MDEVGRIFQASFESRNGEEGEMRKSDGGRLRDRIGGSLMIAIGLAAALQGMTYSVGQMAHIGPGFFPVALGVILALVGAAITVTASAEQAGSERLRHGAEWRGWGCIALAVLAFVVLGRYGGLVPATFAVVFISALGDRKNTVWEALALAVGVVVVCIIVFWWALQVQFPLFSWD